MALALSQMKSRWILGVSLVPAVMLSIFYGAVHQGGVIRAVTSQHPNATVLFYKTYMPPDYLNSHSRIIDMMDKTVDDLEQSVYLHGGDVNVVSIVHPCTVSLNFRRREKKVTESRLGWHFSGENPPSSFTDLCLKVSRFSNS